MKTNEIRVQRCMIPVSTLGQFIDCITSNGKLKHVWTAESTIESLADCSPKGSRGS